MLAMLRRATGIDLGWGGAGHTALRTDRDTCTRATPLACWHRRRMQICKQFVPSAAVWTQAPCRLVYRPTYEHFGELTVSIFKVQLRRRQQVAVDPLVSRNQSASHPRRLESFVHPYIRDAANISVFNTLLVVTRFACMNGEVGQE